jgi:mRNA interferase MazF
MRCLLRKKKRLFSLCFVAIILPGTFLIKHSICSQTSFLLASMPRRASMPPSADRGSVWIVDLGMVAKIRPCLVLSIRTEPVDRVLVTVVPHTTQVHGTLFEVDVDAAFLKAGVFDAQQIVTVAQARLVRRIGELEPESLALVEDAVRRWLGL